MTNFWTPPSGNKITGEADKAFLSDFSIIPENSKAVASIKKFVRVDKDANEYTGKQSYLEITYKLIDGDFKGREVSQKIKCFDGTDTSLERNLNMLMLVMKLCDFKPTHGGEPTAEELAGMQGTVLGIVIGEWSIAKKDGGIMEGNNVREVYSAEGFECETGVKVESKPEPVTSMPESAFTRDKARRDADAKEMMDDDIPFK